MTIPSKPINLQLDQKTITLGQIRRLSKVDAVTLDVFIAFIQSHSDWTEPEFDELTLEEWGQVQQKVADVLTQLAVPKATTPA